MRMRLNKIPLTSFRGPFRGKTANDDGDNDNGFGNDDDSFAVLSELREVAGRCG